MPGFFYLKKKTCGRNSAQLPQYEFAPAAAGLRIGRWLYADADETALEGCQANWRPARPRRTGARGGGALGGRVPGRFQPAHPAHGVGARHARKVPDASLDDPDVGRMEGRIAPPPTHER